MSKDLQAAIRHLAETFAQGVLDAVRSSSLEEIQNNRATASGRGPGRPRKSADVAPPSFKAAASSGATARGGKRGRPAKSNGAATGPDVSVDRIVYLVRKSPQGVRSEELRARLKLEKLEFRQAAARALAANLITKTGEKRSTTFFSK